jgi:hypothetical protein
MSHKIYRKETNCLNCGVEVTGKFCPNCGQENLETKENFFHLAGHFISDYFHYDAKFFQSIISLFAKPGFLTRQYWEGKRVRFIHPLRLFFFITIAFAISSTVFYKRFGNDLRSTVVKPDKVMSQFDSANLASMHDTTRVFVPEWKQTFRAKELKEYKTRDARIHRKLKAGIDVFFSFLKYITFLLLPLYALIFKVLYRRSNKLYVEHLVYTLHLQSFAYALSSILFLVPFFIPESSELLIRLMILLMFVYTMFSLRYLYQQSWVKTVIKSVLATVGLVFTTSLGMAIVALVDGMFFEK